MQSARPVTAFFKQFVQHGIDPAAQYLSAVVNQRLFELKPKELLPLLQRRGKEEVAEMSRGNALFEGRASLSKLFDHYKGFLKSNGFSTNIAKTMKEFKIQITVALGTSAQEDEDDEEADDGNKEDGGQEKPSKEAQDEKEETEKGLFASVTRESMERVGFNCARYAEGEFAVFKYDALKERLKAKKRYVWDVQTLQPLFEFEEDPKSKIALKVQKDAQAPPSLAAAAGAASSSSATTALAAIAGTPPMRRRRSAAPLHQPPTSGTKFCRRRRT